MPCQGKLSDISNTELQLHTAQGWTSFGLIYMVHLHFQHFC